MTNELRRPPTDAVTRFSSRAENYARYRPGYPPEVIRCFSDEFGLTAQCAVADMGSGTGVFSAMLLEHGNRVFAVEPNPAMRKIAETRLGSFPHFFSIDGSAENTTLAPHSVDWITVAQAFHWFNVDPCRQEFQRILKTGGMVALLWNNRRHHTPFLEEYERFIRLFGIDYDRIRHEDAESDGRIERLFGHDRFAVRTFDNAQRCDWETFRGRVLSASYMPQPDHPTFCVMIRSLEGLFENHAASGAVLIEYETRSYVGALC